MSSCTHTHYVQLNAYRSEPQHSIHKQRFNLNIYVSAQCRCACTTYIPRTMPRLFLMASVCDAGPHGPKSLGAQLQRLSEIS